MRLHNYQVEFGLYSFTVGIERNDRLSIPYVVLEKPGNTFSIPAEKIEELGKILVKIGEKLKGKYPLLTEDDIPF